jgi:hypothetical protein
MSESLRSSHHNTGIESLLKDPISLPDGSKFSSTPIQLTIHEMIALSERYLPILNSDPDFESKRRETGFDNPFVL